MIIIKTKDFETLPSRTFYNETESLFSYLLRVASNNGISVLLLLNMFRKNEKYLLHKGDIRRIDYYPESIFDLKKLIELTGLTQSDLYRSTFTNVLHAFGYYNNGEKARLMKNMIRENLHFCTQCLEEGRGYNLMWKVEGVDYCLKHNLRLLDQCQHCKQVIGYHQVLTIECCPHCDQLLTDRSSGSFDREIDNMTYQQSLQMNLNQLANGIGLRFEAQCLAQKLLYLMNDFKPEYQADTIKNSLKEYSLGHLLQHARGTISAPKNIKLSLILRVLHSRSLSINCLYKMEVPETFENSLIEGKSIQWTREVTCEAPWCTGRGQQNSLVPTNSKHASKSGERLSHYLVCRECYCEYAFDENRNLVERTSFINAFNTMRKFSNISKMTWLEKKKRFSMNKERIRRASAYFYTRQLSEEEIVGGNKIDLLLLKKIINALRNKEALADIRFWMIWKNYDQYLIHRYHPLVMKEIFELRYMVKSSP